jgi:hypothetical protein
MAGLLSQLCISFLLKLCQLAPWSDAAHEDHKLRNKMIWTALSVFFVYILYAM